jgi:Mor family transcriptional regulator
MNNGIKLTPALIVEMVAQYNTGTTTTELSKKYNISKATVCRGLRKMGVEPERKDNLFTVKELTKEQEDSILLDFRSGYKITELVKKYDTGYTKIVKLLEDNSLWIKKKINKIKLPNMESKIIKVGESGIKHILGDVEKIEICEKYVDGSYTKFELAEEYQVHVDTIGAILKAANIATKRYVPQEIKDQFCEEYKKGNCTIHDLAKIYSLSSETIKYWLTKENLLDTSIAGNPNPTKSPGLTAGQMRKLARENSERAFQILLDIANDASPTVRPRERLTAAQLIIDRAFGKPREEPEEEKDTESTTAKILRLVGKKTDKKE